MAQLTKLNVWQYIQMIRLNFENAYRTQSDDDKLLLINSWYEILKAYPKELCDKALMNALKNAEFAPRVGTIVHEIEKMQAVFDKSDSDLWDELQSVLHAVGRCVYAFGYTYVDETGISQGEQARREVEKIFNGLSSEIQDYLHNTNALCDIATLDFEQLQFEKARFLKVIPTIKARVKTRAELPPELSAIVQGLLTDGLKLLK